MNISFKWLQDFIKIDKSPEKVAGDLTLLGSEVEEMTKQNGDTIFKLEVTPNRGDLLSHLGVARELGALYRTGIRNPRTRASSVRGRHESGIRDGRTTKKIKILNTVPKLCPRYTYRIIENIKLKNSSDLIKKRLKAYGFRSLNNIVDITNYVMIEMGQPLHAFDLDKIRKIAGRDVPEIIIREAKQPVSAPPKAGLRRGEGEEITTLDGKIHKLPKTAIVYEVGGELVDLAGIMGGLNSEVDEKTKTVLLQGAIFNPKAIRRASRALNHVTDASYRYERGIDFEGGVVGVDRAAELILENCKDAKIGKLEDKIYEKPNEIKIKYSPEKINEFIGIDVSADEMEMILEAEGIKHNPPASPLVKGGKRGVVVPSWRHDLHIWQDLTEEIARFYGYNLIKRRSIEPIKINNLKKDWMQKELLKDKLAKFGLTEVLNYSFVSDSDVKNFRLDKNEIAASSPDGDRGTPRNDTGGRLIEIEKPVAENIRYLRSSLLPGLLGVVAKNPSEDAISIFEIGHIWEGSKEKISLGIALAGKKATDKDMLSKMLNKVGFPSLKWKKSDKKTIEALKIRKSDVFTLELDISPFLKKKPLRGVLRSQEVVEYRRISKYPSISRDIAFIIDKDLSADKVGKAILNTSKKIKKVELFDEFASDKFGKGKKNIAYHLTFQAEDHTMTDKEGDKIFDSIVRDIKEKFNGKLRDK